MRLILLMLLALPAYAVAPTFTQEELIGERKIEAPECKDGVCTMDEADLAFIHQRGRLMEEIANRLYQRLQSCNGGRST